MDLAGIIDHTLLDPLSTEQDVFRVCQEAIQCSFAAVCILPTRVEAAVRFLKDSPTQVCTVVGFPLGASSSEAKIVEASQAIGAGADEIDVVVNLGWVKDGRWEAIESEMHSLRAVCQDAVLKVILETGALDRKEKVLLARMAQRVGVDFVKTSTGFGAHGGASVEDVALLRLETSPFMGIKASGGIRDAATAQAMLEAGATRLGTSHGLAIVGQRTPSEPPPSY